MSGITDQNLRILNARHRTATSVIAVEILAVVVLSALSFRRFPIFTKPADEQTLMSLWMGVLFLAAGSFLLRRIFNNWERLSNIAILRGIPGVTSKLAANSTITSFFGVLAAAVGFAISQMTGDPFDMLRASAVSLVVFFANYPRKSVWRAVVARFQEQ